ncbi:IS1 family transposase [Olsenella sp. Marseille-P4559]|uniref:IS1 family transposase n=1 Tax=Olsenella sp. Marseille-P4559 TaxID=2364795 RepID=UPI00103184B1|nr:IS1 family transposase [Olsenella sp. Marseille-P4559]
MDSMMLQRPQRLGIAEERELLERLKALMAGEMAGSALAGSPERCPGCGSSDSFRKGRDSHGLQRWKCRSCGRTFSARTGSVLAMSRLSAATWAAYAEGALAGMTLGCSPLPATSASGRPGSCAWGPPGRWGRRSSPSGMAPPHRARRAAPTSTSRSRATGGGPI